VVKVGVGIDLVYGFGLGDGTTVEPTLNPLLDWSEAREIARLVVPGAFRIDDSGELIPWLVEQIPRPGNGGVVIDADGTVTVTYRVRSDAVWEDGTPVTAADFAFTHELIMAGGDTIFRAVHELIEPGSIVVDDRVLSLRLTRASPSYERLFEWVLPAHIIDPLTFADHWNDRLWPSAGPFRFVSLERSSRSDAEPSIVVLERNTSYWETDPETGAQLPYLDRIEVHAFSPGGMDERTMVSFIQSGDIDAIVGWVIRPHVMQFIGDPTELGLEAHVEWDSLFEVMVFNLADTRFEVNPASNNGDLDYRRAVLAALDRSTVADEVNSKAMTSIAGAAVDAYDHDAWDQHDDRAAVDRLLAVAGVEAPIALYTTSNGDETIRIGDVVVDRLNAAGITTTAEYPGDFFGTELSQRLVDIYAIRLFAGGGGLSGVAEMLEIFEREADAMPLVDWTGLDDEAARYSAVVASAQAELDPDRLAQLIEEAERILADNALIYPLVRRQPSYRIYRPGRIQGIAPNRFQGWDTWNAAWWWSPEG
jgi:ABC-type transport system substrate-binding protein